MFVSKCCTPVRLIQELRQFVQQVWPSPKRNAVKATHLPTFSPIPACIAAVSSFIPCASHHLRGMLAIQTDAFHIRL